MLPKKTSSIKQRLLSISGIFLLLFTLIQQSCKKAEIYSANPAIQTFLTFQNSNDIELQKVLTDFKKQIEKKNFIPDFLNWHGQPLWDKSIKFKKDDSTFYLIIPTKKTGKNTIETFFIASYKNGKFNYEMHRRSSLATNAEEFSVFSYTPKRIKLLLDFFDTVILQKSDGEKISEVNKNKQTSLISKSNQSIPIANSTNPQSDDCYEMELWWNPDGDIGNNNGDEFFTGISYWVGNCGWSTGDVTDFPTPSGVTGSFFSEYYTGPGQGGGTPPGGNGTGGGPCESGEVWYSQMPAPCHLVDANGFFYERIAELKSQLLLNSKELLPCPILAALQTLAPFYQDLLNFQPGWEVDNRISQLATQFPSQTFQIQKIDDASGTIVNADYFPLHISTLPTINGVQMTPVDFLEYFRLNIQSFISIPGDICTPYNYQGIDDNNLWSQPTTLSILAMVHFNTLLPLGNGTVIESNYTSDFTANNFQWTFSTMYSPQDGAHPVSGNRRFGIFPDPQGGYIFYIGGLDRVTNEWISVADALFNNFGLSVATDLWRNIITNVNTFINSQVNGGNPNSSNYYPFGDFVIQPDYNALKRYLRGEITYAQFKALLGC